MMKMTQVMKSNRALAALIGSVVLGVAIPAAQAKDAQPSGSDLKSESSRKAAEPKAGRAPEENRKSGGHPVTPGVDPASSESMKAPSSGSMGHPTGGDSPKQEGGASGARGAQQQGAPRK